MSDFIEEIRCALAMREAGYDALLGHEATAELLRRHDVMVKALEKAHRWFEMANDGEEGTHYMNGDSDKYSGSGYADGDALQVELRDLLAVVGSLQQPVDK